MKYLLLLCLLPFIFGCATLNLSTIEEAARTDFQPLILEPHFDVYNIRIDVIRQTDESETDDSTTGTEERRYHPVGFNLGNGLFLDLNDNLSFLVPELLNVDPGENFTITQQSFGHLVNTTTTYKLADSLFVKVNKGLITTRSKKRIHRNDSVLLVNEGLFSKYRITGSDSSYSYHSGLSNTTLHKTDQGYYYNTLFGRYEYKKRDNEINIGKRYIVRNRGDQIEIVERGLFNGENLLYKIIKSDNRLILYDRNYRGKEIIAGKGALYVNKNGKSEDKYTLE